MSIEQRAAIIDKHLSALMEHFDCIQIFASVHESANDSTHSFAMGQGNRNARYGQVVKWVDNEDIMAAEIAANSVQNMQEEDDDRETA